MPETLFHGTLSPLEPGEDTLLSSAEVTRRGLNRHSILTLQYADTGRRLGYDDTTMLLDDGSEVRREDMVYLCDNVDGAATWAAAPLLKASPQDFNRMHDEGAGLIRVYEVTPVRPRRPVHPHSHDEWVADEAAVIRLVWSEPLDRPCRNVEGCEGYLEPGDTVCPECGTAW